MVDICLYPINHCKSLNTSRNSNSVIKYCNIISPLTTKCILNITYLETKNSLLINILLGISLQKYIIIT